MWFTDKSMILYKEWVALVRGQKTKSVNVRRRVLRELPKNKAMTVLVKMMLV